MTELHVDADVLASPASGVAVYLQEVLKYLPSDVAVTLRSAAGTPNAPRLRSSAAARNILRHVPGAYALRSLRSGWPPVPRGAAFWQPNFLLPPWPLTPTQAVATIHDTIFIDHPAWADAQRSRFLRLRLAGTLRDASCIITPSEPVAARLRSLDARARCVVIPEGIRRLAAAAAARTSILCFGNIEPRKGTHVLVAAYRALPERLRRAHPLIIAGAVHDAQYARDISVVARPDDATLAGLIAQSAVVVAPSLAEGFGLVPLEAYAAGACVIASDLPVTRELLGERIDYFAAGDAAGLRAQLERLLGAPRYASAEAREAIAAKYSWQGCAEAHAKIFRAVAAKALR